MAEKGGGAAVKVRLNVSAGRYEALKTQLEAQGIEVDEAADLV